MGSSSSSRDSVIFRELVILFELYSRNWLASNILLLASTKCVLTSQRLVGAGMNWRVLLNLGLRLDRQVTFSVQNRQVTFRFKMKQVIFRVMVNGCISYI